MLALLGRCVEAEDVVARGVVEKVGFGGGDVVAELPVSCRLSALCCLLEPHKGVVDVPTYETGMRRG